MTEFFDHIELTDLMTRGSFKKTLVELFTKSEYVLVLKKLSNKDKTLVQVKHVLELEISQSFKEKILNH